MAIDFDAGEYAGLTASPPTFASPWTIMAWIKAAFSASDRAFLFFGDGTQVTQWTYAGMQSGSNLVRLANTDWGAVAGADIGSGWHHWAWVREAAGTTRLYIDGTSAVTINNQGGTPTG